MSSTVLDVRNLKRVIDGRVIITNLSFSVQSPGDVLFIRGASGVGKSLLLRVLACLDPLQEGTLALDERTPQQIGVPSWRALVSYIPQARVQLKGTPSELYFTAQRFAAQKGRPRGDLPALIHELGLQQGVLNQSWTELSGGEAQRVLLAVALALKPQFVLLDEVTSALDHESAIKTEKVLKDSGAALIWVTHDDSQPARVGGRILQLPLGTEMAVEQLLTSPRISHDELEFGPELEAPSNGKE